MKRTALCTAVIALSTTQPVLARSLIDFDTPYHLRATGQGFLTTQSEGSAFINGMLPIAGDENRMFFVDGLFMQGRDREQVSSMAFGLRQRRGTAIGDALLGAYVAGDYLRTIKGQNAWIINPGLEILTVKQEARLNVYTPVGGRKKAYGNAMASSIGQDVIDDAGLPGNDLVRAFGNNFLDRPVALLEEIPLGAEIELGQKLTHGMWLRAGGYYFTYKSAKSTEGVQANLDIPLQTHGAHLLFMDSYDNRRHNLFSVGVRFDVGDTGDNRDGILSRMTDPLRRHLASVQVGSSVPVRLGYEANGPAQILENVAFFTPGGNNPAPFAGLTDFGICTAENPCALTQDNINAFEDRNANNSYYFIAKGTYSTGNEPFTFNGTLATQGSSQVWGFDSNSFNHQAQGDDRPLINGALFWGNDDNDGGPNQAISTGVIKNLRINNNNQVEIEGGQSGQGDDAFIAAGATNDITIENSSLVVSRSLNNPGNDFVAYSVGVFSDIGVATVRNSSVNASLYVTGNVVTAFAAGVSGDSGARVTNSDISVSVVNQGSNAVNIIQGVYAENSSIDIRNSHINVSSAIDANNEADTFVGVVAGDEVTITNSQVNVTAQAQAADYNPRLVGAFADERLTITNSTVNVNQSVNSDAFQGVVYATSSDDLMTIENSALSVNSYLATTIGIPNNNISAVRALGETSITKSHISNDVSINGNSSIDAGITIWAVVNTGNTSVIDSDIEVSTNVMADNVNGIYQGGFFLKMAN